MFIENVASTLGSAAMCAYRSMNALAMPISSRTAEDMPCACFCANSPSSFEERSATSWHTLESSSASPIPDDPIGSDPAVQFSGIVQVVQMGHRLAHREESLVQVKRPPEQHAEQLACAAGFSPQLFAELFEAVFMMRFELRHALVRAAKRLAVRGQHQHLRRQVPVARDRVEKQAQRVALR